MTRHVKESIQWKSTDKIDWLKNVTKSDLLKIVLSAKKAGQLTKEEFMYFATVETKAKEYDDVANYYIQVYEELKQKLKDNEEKELILKLQQYASELETETDPMNRLELMDIIEYLEDKLSKR